MGMDQPTKEPVGPIAAERQSRDELWLGAFETYYTAYFEELMAARLVTWWQRVDDVTKVLVALTASGSAVAGWSLWNQEYYKNFWVAAAGIAAVLSIVHAALGVPAKLKDHTGIQRRFASLRTDLETFRYRMRISPSFPVKDFTEMFATFRKRLGDEVQLLQTDLLSTDGLQERVQDRLNVILQAELEQP
ncbi:MAG: hypothetical protein HYR72_08480 [Deltaproteobacteria bacterium]|nr:hypothetical protein [Deltaproteobacteria bacterium]MBI3388789.1 hypothetical protein [Deltaproteobacteria bacterium]